MTRIIVTGGAGYIGSHTCLVLLEKGYEVIVVDNLSNSHYESIKRVERITGRNIKFYELDLLDRQALEGVFEKENPSSVIHFAGLKSVNESVMIPLRYYSNNITGTLVLLETMMKYNVTNIVFSSSAAVYGDAEQVPILESAALKTINPYGRTKRMIEEILHDIYKAECCWNVIQLRYFNPVGAHESGLIGEDPGGIPNNLVPYIAQVNAGRLKTLSVYGNDYQTPDGTGVRDYIHVMDLAVGHIHAVEKMKENPGSTIYNLGTGRGYSVLEVLAAYEKAAGKPIPHKIVARRPGDSAISYADPSKALKELGWKATRDIDEMCRDTLNWQTKNPNGFSDSQ